MAFVDLRYILTLKRDAHHIFAAAFSGLRRRANERDRELSVVDDQDTCEMLVAGC